MPRSPRCNTKRRYHHPGWFPWVFMAAAVALLTALGVWQLQRLAWKETMLARLEVGQQLVPITSLPQASQPWEDALYRRVKLTGDLLRQSYFLRIGIHRSYGNGYYVLSPLLLPGAAGENQLILVNRGFIAGDHAQVEQALAAETTKNPTVIEGLMRPAYAPRLFSPKNHADKNIWSSEDLSAMEPLLRQQLQAESDNHAALAPYVIEASGEIPMSASPAPHPNTAKIRLRNDHFGYAITWFGLALTGLVMFWFFCWRPTAKAEDYKSQG